MSWWVLALALEANDVVTLELVAGGELEGRVLTGDDEGLTLTFDNREQVVPWTLVEVALVNGEPMDLPQLEREVIEFDLRRQKPPPDRSGPPLAVVGASSILWPGTGHLLLGDWRSFVGYSVLEAGLLGAAAWWIFVEGNAAPVVPIAGLSGAFRVWSAADAVYTARKRRTRVGLAPIPAGGMVICISLTG
jgi:hypothetical protein